jgi:Mn2+/Fe2+ NRAMP family transporter
MATLVGILLNLLGINPISALVYSAVINGIVAVPLLVLILLLANNRSIMGGTRMAGSPTAWAS